MIKSSIPTNGTNIHNKLQTIEFLLDTIEEDLDKTDNKEKAFSNVISVLPNIKQEWEKIKGHDTMTFFELIDYCELWAVDLASAINYNRGFKKNARLIVHIRECVEICRSVVLIAHHHIHQTS